MDKPAHIKTPKLKDARSRGTKAIFFSYNHVGDALRGKTLKEIEKIFIQEAPNNLANRSEKNGSPLSRSSYLSTEKPANQNSNKFYRSYRYIANNDGSPRWIFPATNRSADFLHFYYQSSAKSKMFALILKTIYLLGLQGLFIRKKLYFLGSQAPYFEKYLQEGDYSIFTGTVGPNRKALLHFASPKGQHYIKIPLSKNSKEKLVIEKKAYHKLQGLELKHTVLAETAEHYRDDFHSIESLGGKSRSSNNLEIAHVTGILELQEQSNSNKRLEVYQKKHHGGLLHLRQFGRSIQVRQLAADCLKFGAALSSDEDLETYQAHGDFTPWNCKIKNDKLYLFDLELSEELPLFYDLLHFVFQSTILLGNQGTDKIKNQLEQARELVNSISVKNFTRSQWNKYLELYLFINTSKNLAVFDQQEELHPQADWLMKAWTSIMKESTPIQAKESHRTSFIPFYFKGIEGLNYALLKGDIEEQFSIGEFSDIDLIIDSKDVQEAIKRAKNYAYISSIKVLNKVHMQQLYIQFKDETFIEIDLIHSFRRKSLIYLSVDDFLRNSISNKSFYKVCREEDQLLFIYFFYQLNDADIPQKYIDKFERSSETEWSNFTGKLEKECNIKIKDKESIYSFDKVQKENIISNLKSKPENKGFRLLKNQFHYGIEVLSGIRNAQGWTMTFSGPDGSGKSTILEDVKHLLDKKYRKKTVVVRHRPSLLPILSSYVHGKKKAESLAASRLPRQGKNKSSLSSLLRFIYYYTDYFFGHIYIYFKYIIRGTVVLYDRYYFDFIADPKRSNIVLSKKITAPLYYLIHHPRHNFLLYAPAETVRKRKQELSISEIRELNQQYREVFDSLEENSSSDRYVAIENTDRQNTVDLIESFLRKSVSA